MIRGNVYIFILFWSTLFWEDNSKGEVLRILCYHIIHWMGFELTPLSYCSTWWQCITWDTLDPSWSWFCSAPAVSYERPLYPSWSQCKAQNYRLAWYVACPGVPMFLPHRDDRDLHNETLDISQQAPWINWPTEARVFLIDPYEIWWALKHTELLDFLSKEDYHTVPSSF